MRFFASLADDGQFARVGIQHFAAIFGDQHKVFDAYAEFAGQINSWLDREAHARLNRSIMSS